MCIVLSHQVDGNVPAATGAHTSCSEQWDLQPCPWQRPRVGGMPLPLPAHCPSLGTESIPQPGLAWALLSWPPGAPPSGHRDNSGSLSPAQPWAVLPLVSRTFEKLLQPHSHSPGLSSRQLLSRWAPCCCLPCWPAAFSNSALLTFGAG